MNYLYNGLPVLFCPFCVLPTLLTGKPKIEISSISIIGVVVSPLTHVPACRIKVIYYHPPPPLSPLLTTTGSA